jgi:hypothetical protein
MLLYFANILSLNITLIDKGLLSPVILIIKIDFLKARRWQAFKKPILVVPAPKALETPKSVS